MLNEDYYYFVGSKGKEYLLYNEYSEPNELPSNNNFKFYLLTQIGYLQLTRLFKDDVAFNLYKDIAKYYLQHHSISELEKRYIVQDNEIDNFYSGDEVI